MPKRPIPHRAVAEPQHGLHRTTPYDDVMAADDKPWPQAPIPGEFPWKDPPGQTLPPEGEPRPTKGVSMRALLVEAASDLRGGIGADPSFHFIETRLAEIATMLPRAIENCSGGLFHLLRGLNEVI